MTNETNNPSDFSPDAPFFPDVPEEILLKADGNYQYLSRLMAVERSRSMLEKIAQQGLIVHDPEEFERARDRLQQANDELTSYEYEKGYLRPPNDEEG